MTFQGADQSPVLFGISLGYFFGWSKIVDNSNVTLLNAFLMQLALPLTLFCAIASTSRGSIFTHWHLAVVLLISTVAVYFLVLYIQIYRYRLDLGSAAVQALTTASPNYTAIGLPLLTPIFGGQAAIMVAIAITVGTISTSPLTLTLLDMHISRRSNGGKRVGLIRQFLIALSTSLRKPIFVGPILGLIVSLSGLELPSIVEIALLPITQTTGGIGLFLTGLILSAQSLKLSRNAVTSLTIKNIFQPIMAFIIAVLFQMPAHVSLQAMLLTAMPAGFFGLVYGITRGVRPQVAGVTLVLSSIASIASLSLALIWFKLG
ncbi:AEC family transporter [Ochrobactrum sp. A-1]|uniref:AEC family transporter n=1 Tax=Ochrobactrum sp. A-1 TaxID=2920940 RepID=UPI00404522EA